MILKIRDFRALIAARFLLSLAMQAQATVVGWLVYEKTKDPMYLGLIGLAEAVPAIGFALYAGHLIDRGRPYLFYRNAIFFLFLNSVFLAYLASSNASYVLALLFASIFMVGAARSVLSPSVFSMIPQIVPREVYAASSAWLSGFFQLAMVLGPSIGGFVYATIGKVPSFLLVIFLAASAAVFASLLSPKVKSFESVVSHQGETTAQSMRAGIEYILREKIILSAMSLDMFSVLFGGATAILPVFSDQVLHAGPAGLGILRAAPAVGALVMSFRLITRPLKTISGKALHIAVAGFGICTIGFGFSHTMPVALAMLFGAGLFDALSVVTRGTLLQITTPDHMRGRVSAVNSIFIGSSNEIGAFESGVAARLMGLVPSVIFGGVMTVLIAATTWFKAPELRKMQIKQG